MSEKQLRKVARKTLELQQEESDCGVAALLSIIQFHDGYIPLEKLRSLSGTTTSGTTMLGLLQAGRSVGLETEAYEANIDELKKLKSPTLLHVVKHEIYEHYVICYGMVRDQFLIGDPEIGIRLIEIEALNKIWKSKALLTFQPTSGHSSKSKNIKEKYDWIKEAISKDQGIVISTIIVGVAITALTFTTAIFTEKLVDNLIPSRNSSTIIIGLVAWFILMGIKVALSYFRELILLRQSYKLNNELIGGFIEKLFKLPKSFFDSRKKGDLISRLFDTERVQSSISTIVSQDIIDILTLIISIIIVAFYHTSISIFLIVLIPAYFLIVKSYYAKIYSSNKQVMASFARNESEYIDKLTGIESIKQLNQVERVSKKLQDQFVQYQDKVVWSGEIRATFRSVNDSFGLLSVFFVLTFCVASVLDQSIQIGDMLAIFSISSMSLASTNRIAFATTHLQEAKAALDRTFDIVSLPSDNLSGIDIQSIDTIAFDNVTFRFAGSKTLLENTSFEIKKQSLTSLQGENGSGKSTIIQLLQNFYTPEDGRILIDSRNIKEISLNSLRARIGVVSQQTKIFNQSLSFNITLKEDFDKNTLGEFISSYKFNKFFDSFPQGIDTILGEEGVKASGGQKQMIALARALFNKPEFLLLDEFTSAMDDHSEKYALELIHDLSTKMGVLIISHDPNIAKLADKKYLLVEKNIKLL